MKTRVITSIPEIFSLRGNDYSSFVVKGGAEEMMRKNWSGVGHRLSGAIVKVGRSADVKQKKQAA
ncbi:hypothetical protein [Sideroxyarcus sp. TK5]